MDHNTLGGNRHIPSSPEKASEVITNIYSLIIVTQHTKRGDIGIACVCPRVFPVYIQSVVISASHVSALVSSHITLVTSIKAL